MSVVNEFRFLCSTSKVEISSISLSVSQVYRVDGAATNAIIYSNGTLDDDGDVVMMMMMI